MGDGAHSWVGKTTGTVRRVEEGVGEMLKAELQGLGMVWVWQGGESRMTGQVRSCLGHPPGILGGRGGWVWSQQRKVPSGSHPRSGPKWCTVQAACLESLV